MQTQKKKKKKKTQKGNCKAFWYTRKHRENNKKFLLQAAITKNV